MCDLDSSVRLVLHCTPLLIEIWNPRWSPARMCPNMDRKPGVLYRSFPVLASLQHWDGQPVSVAIRLHAGVQCPVHLP